MQQTIAKDISFFNAAHNDLPVAKEEDNIHSGHLHMPRIVAIWHFGRDPLTEYTGEKFETSWGDRL